MADVHDLSSARRDRRLRLLQGRPASADAEVHARALEQIRDARLARDGLQTDVQMRSADIAVALLRDGVAPPTLDTYVRAASLAADARSAAQDHSEARRIATETEEVAATCDPRSLEHFAASRQLASTIELAGDPCDAASRCMGLFMQTRSLPGLTAYRLAVENLRLLHVVHTAAKRCGCSKCMSMARLATERGELVARRLESRNLQLVSVYRQRAGFTESWLRGPSQAAVSMLQWSRATRGDSARNRASVKTIDAELHLMRGHEAAAVRLLRSAAADFATGVPRKAVSIDLLIQRRGLAA